MIELAAIDLRARTGELAALTAAFLWAISSVIYRHLGQRTHPLLLNFLKGAIATGFLAATVLLLGRPWPTVPIGAFGLLLLSGAIGIGLGDTAYFAALNQIGARQTLLIRVLAPPISACGSALFLREQLPLTAWAGIAITIVGVAWVVRDRTTVASETAIPLQQKGVIFALLATLGDAIGAVLSRMALSQTTIEPLWGALLRLFGGTIVVGVLLWGQRRSLPLPSKHQTQKVIQSVLVVAFFSTYLGIWLQQIALKLTSAGVVQTLGATSPLFVLPIVLWQGERLGWQAVIGSVVAIGGVAMLLLWQ
jgi:drug/metabolite transporter (DMT)-like permease